MPELNELQLSNCFDGFEEIGEAIVKEKRYGKVLDIGNLWKELTPLRVFGSGSGHPFPHPQFTYKGQGPEAFEQYKKRG